MVVGCFNEQGNVARFPGELFAELERLEVPEWEAVLVDDGSGDGTWDAMRAVSEGRSNVRTVRHDRNRGLGAALKTAFANATGDAILALDADLTFHPSEIRTLLSAYGPSVDCVIGSPWLGHLGGVPWFRRLLSWSVNRVYRLCLGTRIGAISAMFRLYRAVPLKGMRIDSDAFDVSAEILFRLLAMKGKVVEVPVTLTDRRVGVSKINTAREIRNHLRLLARILRHRLSS